MKLAIYLVCILAALGFVAYKIVGYFGDNSPLAPRVPVAQHQQVQTVETKAEVLTAKDHAERNQLPAIERIAHTDNPVFPGASLWVTGVVRRPSRGFVRVTLSDGTTITERDAKILVGVSSVTIDGRKFPMVPPFQPVVDESTEQPLNLVDDREAAQSAGTPQSGKSWGIGGRAPEKGDPEEADLQGLLPAAS